MVEIAPDKVRGDGLNLFGLRRTADESSSCHVAGRISPGSQRRADFTKPMVVHDCGSCPVGDRSHFGYSENPNIVRPPRRTLERRRGRQPSMMSIMVELVCQPRCWWLFFARGRGVPNPSVIAS